MAYFPFLPVLWERQLNLSLWKKAKQLLMLIVFSNPIITIDVKKGIFSFPPKAYWKSPKLKNVHKIMGYEISLCEYDVYYII